MKCFYHKADYDGQCSAAIVKYRYPECELIGIDYKDKFPFDRVAEGETVFMVDFSLSPITDMMFLSLKSNLIWIDHHISAIKEYENFPDEKPVIFGTRDTSKAGCELTWEFLYPDIDMPRAVRLLGRYDVWDLESNWDVLPFQYGMKVYNTEPTNMMFWAPLFRNGNDIWIDHTISQGKTILQFINKENTKFCKETAFELEFEGYRCICINRPGSTNSQMFDSIYHPVAGHDIMIAFGWQSDIWKFSLYTTKPEINVSEIAKKYGGGGHAQAAGFYAVDLPAEFRNELGLTI